MCAAKKSEQQKLENISCTGRWQARTTKKFWFTQPDLMINSFDFGWETHGAPEKNSSGAWQCAVQSNDRIWVAAFQKLWAEQKAVELVYKDWRLPISGFIKRSDQ